ncbi:Dph6-related ATP pyrophosphatase [Pseudofulvibacter geojedonensis]|uniref:Diphthine--ammonia ligase n=1 Tax=Pseudofulvibacter geojedonensis TaxID=1123758 RepID=A0ABW3HZL2_9FLAO
MNILSSWSGGKDSCYALMKAIEMNYSPSVLLNIMNENGEISRSHGIPLDILKKQSQAINIPLHTQPSTWNNYEDNYIKTLKKLTVNYDLSAAVFGDIDIISHREWEEKVCNAANIKALLPLWQGNRKDLVLEMINAGIKAIIVSCNLELGVDFLGREINESLLDELDKMGVDCCGENGEYHTLVIDCPLFSSPIDLPKTEKIKHEHYCFLNWTTS